MYLNPRSDFRSFIEPMGSECIFGGARTLQKRIAKCQIMRESWPTSWSNPHHTGVWTAAVQTSCGLVWKVQRITHQLKSIALSQPPKEWERILKYHILEPVTHKDFNLDKIWASYKLVWYGTQFQNNWTVHSFWAALMWTVNFSNFYILVVDDTIDANHAFIR